MDRDSKLLAEAYKLVVNEDEKPVLTLDNVLSLVFNLKLNTGVCISDREPQHAHAGFNVEKIQLDYENWGWRVLEWTTGGNPQTIEDEEELKNFIQEQLAHDKFYFHEKYRVTDREGQPLRSYVPEYDPHDQSLGDYEQYGPDPGPRMQDLQ